MRHAQEFEAFMKNYQNMVFSTAMRLLANESDAQDISQDVFLRAYEHFPELRSSPTVGGWLKKVTTNLSLNHLTRYRSRWRFFSDLFVSHSGEEEPELDIPDPHNPAEEICQADRHILVEQTLQKLPAAQRVPLVLYHFEGLTYEEIAQKLKVSLGKVKTDIFRGRETLRKKLRLRLDEEEGPNSGRAGEGTFSPPPHRQSARPQNT